ncbi:MAG: O-antigen ligase family protein [Firmicutes bacterium]|nr:O-antigen ligase family protein [Bacillota bacterium]
MVNRWAVLRVLFVLWLTVGFVLPNTFWENISASALIRWIWRDLPPLSALLAAAIAFVVAWGSFGREAARERWASLLWLLLPVLASGYLFDPLERGYTGAGYMRCSMVLLFIAVGLACARLLRLDQLMGVVAVLAFGQAVYTLTYYWQGQNLFHTYRLARAGGTFGTPVHVYTLMLIALPMGVALWWRLRYHKVGIAVLTMAMLMSVALWLTYSRSAWLAASVVLPASLWALSRWKGLAVALGVALWILLGGMYLLRLESSPLGDTTAQARVEIWRMGWKLFRENWLWGVGTDNVRLRYTSTWRGYAVSTWYGAPENQLLLWLCERGVWGGVFAIMLVAGFFQRLRLLTPVYRWGLGGALLSIAILGMFQSVFGRVEEAVETLLLSAVWGSILREELTHHA